MVWGLPLIFLNLFPELTITPKEPWLLTVNDLTWQRAVTNLLTKQGFRLLALMGWGSVGVGYIYLIKPLLPKRKRRPSWSKRVAGLVDRPSLEWVIEGRRGSLLMEYAKWVNG